LGRAFLLRRFYNQWYRQPSWLAKVLRAFFKTTPSSPVRQLLLSSPDEFTAPGSTPGIT
jgi:hypothetical protein